MNSRFSLAAIILAVLMFAVSANADTFVVDRTDDGGGTLFNACTPSPNDCTFRGAIFNANQNGPGHDTINFDIPGTGPHTITYAFAMYPIQTSLTINGATQTGYFGKPMIELNGNSNAGYAIRIVGDGENTTNIMVIGLAMNRFFDSPVYSECLGTCNINLYGNFIGTDPAGTVALGNGGSGIEILPSENSTINIGGSGVFEGNIISGNDRHGIDIPRSTRLGDPNIQSSQVNIVGNKIGTDFNGQADLGNGEEGIKVISLLGVVDVPVLLTVGGSTSSSRNVISGNRTGIYLAVPSATIRGNMIGTNVNGTSAIPNSSDGIFTNTFNNTNYVIGGIGANDGNVISGNNGNGIEIFTSHENVPGTASFTIQGNMIGTTAVGNAALPNSSNGVFIEGNIPFGNYDPSMVTAVVSFGGLAAASKNVISGNGSSGVLIGSGDVLFYRNHIGTNSDGTAALGNKSYGISIYDAAKVTIGGTLLSAGTPVDAGNVISGNGGNMQGGDGIRIWDLHSGQTFIRRNRIGTNAAGTGAIPNLKNGIRVGNANTVIGSDAVADDGNVISGNMEHGIWLSGIQEDPKNTKIFGNRIGTNGVGGAPLPNSLHGIYVFQSPNNLIGQGGIGSKSNVIAGNGGSGIAVVGGNSTGNRIEGNYIGTGPVLNDLGNQANGVGLLNSASNNFIGGSNGAGNIIAFNVTGVNVLNGANNEIRQNSIFLNDGLGIDLGDNGVTPNDPGDADNGANRLQNFPVLNRATPNAISGTLNSTPGGNFTIDFFRVDSCDSSGHGEGRYYLGSTLVQTNILTGDGSFEFPTALSVGQVVSATATVTDIIGADDTSEFSQCKVVTPAPTFSFSLANYAVSEGVASRTIIVQRGGASDGIATVDFATSNGTAIEGEDYTGNSGTLMFGDGETIKTFDVAILPDTIDENNETVNMTLSNPTGGATLAAPSTAVLTITDDDPTPSISIDDITVQEGNAGGITYNFTVSLSSQSSKTITVDVATANGTATAPSDYLSQAVQLNFAPGVTIKNFPVTIVGDSEVEPDETFFVNLSNPGNATIADNQAVGTILNDDAAYSIRGEVRRPDNTPIWGATMTLSGSQSAQTTTDASGRYTFTDLAGNGNYTITPSAPMYDFTPEDREYFDLGENVTDAHFTGEQVAARSVDIISGYAIPGQTGGVSILFEATGNENTLAFSLDYDGTLLSDPQVSAQGGTQGAAMVVDTSMPNRVGITFTLPAGQSFSQGSHSMASVTFTSVLTNAASTPVNFADKPVARAVTDTAGNETNSAYVNGFVFFAQGYESDVSPRPTGKGDGTIVSNDLDQVGLFVVGLETVNPLVNEFQRADSAPRSSLGNGEITVADFVQAARYASGFDPVTTAGGAVVNVNQSGRSKALVPQGIASNVHIVNAISSPGSVVNVRVEADLNGNENAFGFTINYDAAKLLNAEVLLGSDAQSAQLFTNLTQPGKAGVVVALPAGQVFSAGTKQLVALRFNVAANAPAGQIPLTFDSSKAVKEIVDINANAVQSSFQDGYVQILGPTAADVSISGRITEASGRAIQGVIVVLTDANGNSRFVRTSSFGYYRFHNVAAGKSYSIVPTSKRFTFDSIVIAPTDDLVNVDFVAQE